MGYFLYDRHNTRIVSKEYKTHAAAQAELTRRRKAAAGEWGVLHAEDDPLFLLGIAEKEYYFRHIEKTVTRVNLMSGVEYRESVNTPLACSPASETYWSM
jgi:hypothetical protein